MKACLLAVLLLFPITAKADAIDDVLGSRCDTFLTADINLLSDGAREAYLALVASWILFTDAFAVDPPFQAVCAAKPQLSVKEAMQEAIASVAN